MQADAAQPSHYPKGMRRRQQILEMAIEQFATRGVDSASLRSIGSALGISHAALRHYFSSRDELLTEVYRAHEDHGRDTFLTGERPDPVAEMTRSADRNSSIPGLVQLYSTLAADALNEDHEVTRDFIAHRFESLRDRLGAAFSRRIDAGEQTAPVEASDLAALLIAASDGLQLQWMLAPDAVDVVRALRAFGALIDAALGESGSADGSAD